MNKEEFQRLLDKYLAGNSSADEEQQLLSYYRSFQGQLTGPRASNESGQLEEAMWQEITARTLANSRVHKLPTADAQAQRATKRSRQWLSYAAAVLLLLTGAGLFIVFKNKPSAPALTGAKQPVNDLLPGSNKAILTLGDGTSIVLDNSANGVISQQGDARVTKSADGTLTYTASGHTGTAIVYNTMRTPRGGRYQVTLPDGTIVWLNSASAITYPTAFTGTERKVTVNGEAYFEVAKRAGQSFRVIAGNTEIQVLGTHFNINAYPDEASLKTTLLEGSVKVVKNEQAVLLTPGQQAVVNTNQPGTGSNVSVVKAADIEQVMAWKNGLFSFKNADIATVMRHLARWYDVEVVYEGEIPGNRFEGDIPMDAPASQVLRVLQKNNVHFRINGNKIVVMP